MRKITLAVLVILLAACGSGAPQAPPSAARLAREIPGTYNCASQAAAAIATGDVTCLVRDGGPGDLEIATFSSSASEVHWIQQNNSYACCVQGDGWAATYQPGTDSGGFSLITKAIGGRVVSG